MRKYSPLDYIKIDIANHFGKDKEQFEDRIEWVNENSPILELYAEQAADPYRYVAAVAAYRDAQKDIPIGYLVGMDACSSGPQILAVLSGCKITAESTGLIGDRRVDLYSKCTDVMNSYLTADVSIPRDTVKSTLMPCFYGSRAKPIEIFGEYTEELAAFYAAREVVAPGACSLISIFTDAWRADALFHKWILPDGHTAYIPVMQMCESKIEVAELGKAAFAYRFNANIGSKRGISLAANITHSVDGFIVRELCRRCNYNRSNLERVLELLQSRKSAEYSAHRLSQLYENTQIMSLIGIEYIDEDTLNSFSNIYLEDLKTLIEDILNRPSFEVLTIHDEFKCHPNYMNYVRKTYIEIMAELAESELLTSILTSIYQTYTKFVKYSDDLGELIRSSEYPLS